MTTETFFNCTKIDELKVDGRVTGYLVHHPDFPDGSIAGVRGNFIQFIAGTVMGYKSRAKDKKNKELKNGKGRYIGHGNKSMGRSNITDVVKNAGEIESFKMELFCEKDGENEYQIYTKAAE